jgi:hypothetical protein
MEGIREEKKRLAGDVRAVAKRLTYEKDCIEHRLHFEKEVRPFLTSVFLLFRNDTPSLSTTAFIPSRRLSVLSYLIPFFLHGIKALQRKAQKYNAEKKESNMKRRKVDEKLRIMGHQKQKLIARLEKAEQVVETPQKRVIAVRHVCRNRGMTAEFEAHARNLMATGGSARQVRDNLVLNADHFLDPCDSLHYKRDVPTERWFSIQREALGVRITPTQSSHLPSLTPDSSFRSNRTFIRSYKLQPANVSCSGGSTKRQLTPTLTVSLSLTLPLTLTLV